MTNKERGNQKRAITVKVKHKESSACSHAAEIMPPLSTESYSDGEPHHKPAEQKAYKRFVNALSLDNGTGWKTELREAGFTPVVAV